MEVTYSRTMGKQFVEGKHNLVMEADPEFVDIDKSHGGRVPVTTRRLFVRVSELCNERQGDFLAALKPFGEVTWVLWLHGHGGPHPRVGHGDRSPIPTGMCEGDDPFGVFFGTVINDCNEIENSCEELWRKPVGWSILVQKACCASCRGFQHLVQFLDLW